MKRRLVILAASVCGLVALGSPVANATQAASSSVKPEATAGCLWVLTYQVCLPNVLA